MPDPRFFETAEPLGLQAVQELTGADVEKASASDLLITGVGALHTAQKTEAAFVTSRAYSTALAQTKACFVFIKPELKDLVPDTVVALVTKHPQWAWSVLSKALHRLRPLGTSTVGDNVTIADTAHVGQGVIIGDDVEIGEGSVIEPYVVIGAGVRIGQNCHIGAHSSLQCAEVGDRVTLSRGVRIGEAGFGVTAGPKGLADIPQLGRVILGNDVSIGANSCVDRGAIEDTIIGDGTKLDNLVQIAHNVVMGRFCVMAAHSGIAGSTRVGDGVQFGGRTAVIDHLTIGDYAQIAAGSLVVRDIEARQKVTGFPAKPARQFLRETVWLEKQARHQKDHSENNDR